MADVMFDVTIGEYTLISLLDALPTDYRYFADRAQLVDEIALDSDKGNICFVAVKHPHAWPFLVVAQRYEPDVFHPGAIVIPETHLLLIGAGERLLAYKLDNPQRLWEDKADIGFLSWARHGNYVLMSAELELAAWNTEGQKLWTTFVEPPWEYSVSEGNVCLDVMGHKSTFPIQTGPNVS